MNILTATFEGGMNTDSSKINYPNNSYLYAENLRLTTSEGLSSLSLSNVKGNVPLVIDDNTLDRSLFVIVASKTVRKDVVLF